MVYTVTFNPAIDYVIRMDEVKLGATNRSKSEEMYFGGKGINVSIVLKELGIDSRVLGFTAGFTGEAIEKGLAEMGIETDFVRLKEGNSRINVKIKSVEETEINGQGPDIDEKAIDVLFEKFYLHSSPNGWATEVTLLCAFGGIQLFCLGIIGEYIGQLYNEVKARPRYIKEEELK